jgi:hypothetical protein
MISVVCVTRQRTENVERLWNSLVLNTRSPVEVLFAVDEDDMPTVKKVNELRDPNGKISVKVLVDFRDYVPLRINSALGSCSGNVIALFGDDVVVETPGWNERMEEEFVWKDGIGVLYCCDDRHDKELCAHPFVGMQMIKALGYAAYEKFFHYFVDTWLHDISKRVERLKYVKDVVIKHLHCDREKAPLDDVYMSNFRYYHHDEEAFNKNMHDRLVDVEKLKKMIMI